MAGLERRHGGSGSFDDSGYFVAEREWQRAHSRCAGPVMGVGVAYPRRLDAHQHVPRANLRHRNGLVLERASRLDQSHRFHHPPLIVRNLPPVGKYKLGLVLPLLSFGFGRSKELAGLDFRFQDLPRGHGVGYCSGVQANLASPASEIACFHRVARVAQG